MKKNPKASSSGTDEAAVNKVIERAKQELEHMIDLNPQVMLLVDRGGSVIRANKALLDLLGLPDYRNLLGKPINSLFRCKDAAFFGRLFRSQEGYQTCESEAQLAGGSRTLRFTVVSSGEGADLSVIVVHDVSGEKEQARHLEKKYKKEAVEALMGGLMHNINQPLTVILIKTHLMHLALEGGPAGQNEAKKNLADIVNLTMQIGDMLKLVEKPTDYITEPYAGGVDIVDLKRSGDVHKQLEASCLKNLELLIQMLDAHEQWAAAHSRRTGEYAFCLSRRMGLNDEKASAMKRCALFHDIGKIGIPDAILQKPSGLTPAEIETMKNHAEMGYNLLRNFPFLEDESMTAYCHHERFDGEGYPRGLAGGDIPLPARIVAVADAFDALRFNRAYHDIMPMERVMKEITNGAGNQFDPDVVKAFNACCSDSDPIFRRTD